MTLTAEALWLNSFFSGYDTAILSFAHKMAELAGSVLTPLNKIITLLGEKGILFFLLAVVLMLFPCMQGKMQHPRDKNLTDRHIFLCRMTNHRQNPVIPVAYLHIIRCC